MYETVSVDRQGPVATLTLDLPERRNAMTPRMAEEFPQAVAELARDDALQVVVLTGRGSAFCAGGDLDALYEQTGWSPERNRAAMGAFYRAFLSILHLPVPTVAAINGPAIGAGLALALACDLRYAATDAKLGATYINIGLYPGMGATHLLPYHIGHARAAELLLTGRLLSAAEAEHLGLINRAVPREALAETVYGVAQEIAQKSPSAVRALKDALRRRMSDGLEAALDVEALAQTISFASTEMRSTLERLRHR
jgi:enoyl-CoA hydratase/carnithine racemase